MQLDLAFSRIQRPFFFFLNVYVHLMQFHSPVFPPLTGLQTLRVILIDDSASVATCANRRTSPAQSTALLPMLGHASRAAASAARGRRARSDRRRRRDDVGGAGDRLSKPSEDAFVRGLLLVVGVPGTGVAIAREGAGHPRVLVGPVPDGDADAALGVGAGLHGALVVGGLLRQQGFRLGQLHADVELGDGDLDAQRREGGHVLLLGAGAGRLAHDEVRLQADAVDARAVRLHQLDQVLRRRRLGPRVLDVVVVVVQLGVGVGGGGRREGDGDVRLTDVLVEDVAAVGAVVVEGCRN